MGSGWLDGCSSGGQAQGGSSDLVGALLSAVAETCLSFRRTHCHFHLILRATAGHVAKPNVKEQEQKPRQPLETAKSCGRGHRHWEERGTGASDSCTLIIKHQPNLAKGPPTALPSSPASSSASASSALDQNLQETLGRNTCSPWGPHPYLPNIWTCSGEPFILGNFFPHLICLFKENKLLLITNTAVEMFGAS